MTTNPLTITEAVQHALTYGYAEIVFDKDSCAGNFKRNFSGKGLMYVSIPNRNLYICGAGGYIMSITIDTPQEAINYINVRFNALALVNAQNNCRAAALVRAIAN